VQSPPICRRSHGRTVTITSTCTREIRGKETADAQQLNEQVCTQLQHTRPCAGALCRSRKVRDKYIDPQSATALTSKTISSCGSTQRQAMRCPSWHLLTPCRAVSHPESPPRFGGQILYTAQVTASTRPNCRTALQNGATVGWCRNQRTLTLEAVEAWEAAPRAQLPRRCEKGGRDQ